MSDGTMKHRAIQRMGSHPAAVWVANLREAGGGRVKLEGRIFEVAARELTDHETEQSWPSLVDVWPAFDQHYQATGERAVFELTPRDQHGR